MRWKTAGLCALALVGTLGCPHAFGRGGTVDRAVHKDVRTAVEEGRCTQTQFNLFCVPDDTSEDCLEECG
jgi:hypothetical protein